MNSIVKSYMIKKAKDFLPFAFLNIKNVNVLLSIILYKFLNPNTKGNYQFKKGKILPLKL
jgi:hypothetical protein